MSNFNSDEKAVLSQGNRAMPSNIFFCERLSSISTSGLKYDITNVFSDLDFLYRSGCFRYLVSFHFIYFADNIAVYKADTVILGCRSSQGNNLLSGAYRKK